MKKIFVDSSFWYALVSRDDANHAKAAALAQELQAAGALLFTSDLVLAETQRFLMAQGPAGHARGVVRHHGHRSVADPGLAGQHRLGHADHPHHVRTETGEHPDLGRGLGAGALTCGFLYHFMPYITGDVAFYSPKISGRIFSIKMSLNRSASSYIGL